MKLPKKYKKACLLLEDKLEDEFIAFATKEKLAYDIGPVSAGGVEDDSLIAAAANNSLWRCVAFMLDGAAVTIDDVARTYGYAPQAVSDQIWRAFVTANDGVPVKMKRAEYDPEMPLADLFVLANCHPALIKLLVSLGEAPGKMVRVSCDTNLPLVLWSISADVITEPTWTPDLFDHFLATYDPAEIGIDNESINRLVRDWSHSYHGFAELCFAADEDKAVAVERVFWKLEELHTNKQEFAEFAADIDTAAAPRFAKVLAYIGASPETPDASIVAEMTCTHCGGTGKVVDVDADLVQAAKKRRMAEISL
jgi:hypothetical protein